MSEMIGNFFFLNHSFKLAVPILEKVIAEHPTHPKARKKLVIAYVETGRLRDAYALYSDIIAEDPSIITSTNPDEEDCPCPVLIENILESGRTFDDPANRCLVLAIYSSYCCLADALVYFTRYLQSYPNDQRATAVIQQLTKAGVNHAIPQSE
ncbi:tetratricopeptide repeat protein [bacterium]|nr:tetratricopeptide repeat protein [bacterium]MBU1637734.1 tetratricopeptide repeat protein [bacterium]MBU1920317.1 tetratricopeptide repeat protein [bacterium]